MPTYGSLANKRYYARYPERRSIERQKNYATTGGANLNRNHCNRWQIWEINFLEKKLYSDRETHFRLGRSVQAIQNMRHKIKKGF